MDPAETVQNQITLLAGRRRQIPRNVPTEVRHTIIIGFLQRANPAQNVQHVEAAAALHHFQVLRGVPTEIQPRLHQRSILAVHLAFAAQQEQFPAALSHLDRPNFHPVGQLGLRIDHSAARQAQVTQRIHPHQRVHHLPDPDIARAVTGKQRIGRLRYVIAHHRINIVAAQRNVRHVPQKLARRQRNIRRQRPGIPRIEILQHDAVESLIIHVAV